MNKQQITNRDFSYVSAYGHEGGGITMVGDTGNRPVRFASMLSAIVITFTLVLSASARAATITVDSLADTGAPGICVLRDAITAANTLTATNGCSAGTGNDRIRFRVSGTITLASTLPQVTDSKLTINGSASPGVTLDGGGGVQVMQVASGATLKLDNLTIADGVAVSPGGGGIENDGTLTVTNSTFAGNSDSNPEFENLGGAIYNGGTLTVTNSTFAGNSAGNGNGAGGLGGAIYNGGTLTVTNSALSNNSIISCCRGAGIDNEGKMTVSNSSFSGNHAVDGGDGGGIENENGGILTVTNSTFSGNYSTCGIGCGSGGGIENSGTLTVVNSTFSGNYTNGGAGGLSNTGTMTIINSTVSGNAAGGLVVATGGGISNGGTLIVTNSTFSSNVATSEMGGAIGGGIYNDGTLIVTNSTFTGNSVSGVDSVGGGISNGDSASLKNTIIASSTGGNCSGAVSDAGYNISDDDSCGFNAIGSSNNTNPMLSSDGLTNNGGPTQTIALAPGSPAIDAIPLTDCTDQDSPPNPIITDQRLFPRPDDEETNCDIGAYEFQDIPFIPFSRIGGGLKIDAQASFFSLNGKFNLGSGGSIDPTTQPVAFSVGSYAIRLPVGSFTKYTTGYVYQKKVNDIFLCLYVFDRLNRGDRTF
jgi:hypothetical protein